MDRIEAHRRFFARLIAASVGIPGGEGPVADAFAATPRERFVGPGPWRVFTAGGYISTPSDDPALLYQDITVALDEKRQINNGQPVLHMACLASLSPKPGNSAAHIGAGTGYYTAILAHLVGPEGSVTAYEIEDDLAQRAQKNLAGMPGVSIHHASGADSALPACDVVYVNAGATAPQPAWLNALRPGGRLLFPLTPAEMGGRPAPGAMLLVTRAAGTEEVVRFDARFVCPAAFIHCAGARDEATARRLTEAFARGDMRHVKSLRRGGVPDVSCWVAGEGWWLSTAPSAA